MNDTKRLKIRELEEPLFPTVGQPVVIIPIIYFGVRAIIIIAAA